MFQIKNYLLKIIIKYIIINQLLILGLVIFINLLELSRIIEKDKQSMISFASGLALEGLKPWVYTITPFLIERPFEQIKLDIDQQKANVNLVGFADYPTLGPSHAEIDGKKLMKLFKNIDSFFPKDSDEAEQYIYQSYKRNGPNFISLKSDNKIGKKW